MCVIKNIYILPILEITYLELKIKLDKISLQFSTKSQWQCTQLCGEIIDKNWTISKNVIFIQK